MPNRRSPDSRPSHRSGRFTVAPSSSSLIIGAPLIQKFYRVYNTGEFDLEVDGIAVKPRSSVDLRVNADVSVTNTSATAGEVVEGVYERIDRPGLEVRSGRFRSKTGGRIIQAGVRALYRFYNTSRANPLTLEYGNAGTFDLAADQTVDISVPLARGVRFTGVGEGVYDRLEMETNVRSGHFRAEGAGTVVIARLDSAKPYRIFNASSVSIAVTDANGTLQEVKGYSSLDLVLPSGDTSVAVVGGAGKIEGAYDVLLP